MGNSILKGNALFFPRDFLWLARVLIACNEDIITVRNALNIFSFFRSPAFDEMGIIRAQKDRPVAYGEKGNSMFFVVTTQEDD